MKWMPISELQTILHSAGLLQDFSTILQDCWTLWKLSCRCVIFLFLVLMTSLLAPSPNTSRKIVPRLLHRKIAARLLQDCWNFFHMCYALIARLFRDCCKIVKAALQDCYKIVHMYYKDEIVARLFLTFHICYALFLRLLKDCYKIVAGLLQTY